MTQTTPNYKRETQRHRSFWFVLSLFFSTNCQEKPPILGAETAPPSQADSSSLPKAVQDEPAIPEGDLARRNCPSFAEPKLVGKVASLGLDEISGLVASEKHPGVLWVHNDSGDGPFVYALSKAGKQLGRFRLPVKARDWEDIALEPRNDGPDYLYIADTGDNLSRRTDGVLVHRFREPEKPSTNVAIQAITDVETAHLRYPDGPSDAEALFVDPISKALYLVTKPRLGWPKLYRAAEFKKNVLLEKVAELTPQQTGIALHLVTGADISRDGSWIALRTYTAITLMRRDPKKSVVDTIAATHCDLPSPNEKQGEAIGFQLDENHNSPPNLITISEGKRSDVFQIELVAR